MPSEADIKRAKNLARGSTLCDCGECIATMASGFAAATAPLEGRIAALVELQARTIDAVRAAMPGVEVVGLAGIAPAIALVRGAYEERIAELEAQVSPEADVTDPFDVVLVAALRRAAATVEGPARAALDALARELRL